MQVYKTEGILRFWRANLVVTSPDGLLDADGCSIEVPDFQP
jgi:hypothetical protein